MSRSRSSLLAFNLREFLGSAPLERIEDEDWGAAFESLRCVPGPSMPTPPSSPVLAPLPDAAPPGFVWVDCFFYGFWMEEHKARTHHHAGPHALLLTPLRTPGAGCPVPALASTGAATGAAVPDPAGGGGGRAGGSVLRRGRVAMHDDRAQCRVHAAARRASGRRQGVDAGTEPSTADSALACTIV